jgi:hypothetical protein
METFITDITYAIQLAVAAVFLLSAVASHRCGCVRLKTFSHAAFQEDVNPSLRLGRTDN